MVLGVLALAGCTSKRNVPASVVGDGPDTVAPRRAMENPAQEELPAVLFVSFEATPQDVVDRMLKMARVTREDVVYDLGCGDGRIVVAAARRHAVKAIGVDINPERVQESLAKVREAGLGHLVSIRQADVFTLDLSDADVVFLYLTPRLNERLMPQLRKLKRGARIISYEFDMGNAKPVEVAREKFDHYGEQRIYKWVVPWEDAETSGWDLFRMSP